MKIEEVIKDVSSVNPEVSPGITQAVFRKNFRLSPTEKVIIVADEAKRTEGLSFLAGALSITNLAELIVISGMTENAQEPSEVVRQKLLAADVGVLVTTYSLTHTQARKQASDRGVRIASLPGATLAMLERTLPVDVPKMVKLSNLLTQKLTQANRVRLTTPAGTDIQANISERKGVADTGLLQTKGSFGNLPSGESFIAPVEESVTGQIVIDASLADIELDEPVKITVKRGIAVRIEGGQAAESLRQAISKAGSQANLVGEIGIGTNPAADPFGDVLESEKALGTAHIAFGNNLGFGGINGALFHSDGVFLAPTLELDGEQVMRGGQVLDS